MRGFPRTIKKGTNMMKQSNLTRLLALALSVLMLLSLSLAALTGCDTDKKNEKTDTSTETATETETEIPLSEATPEQALAAVAENLSAKGNTLSKDLVKDGKFNFGTNLKVEATASVAMKITLTGTTQTTEIKATVTVMVAENGVSVSITIPEMLDASIVLVGNEFYMSVNSMGFENKSKIVLSDDDMKKVSDFLNGKTVSDPEDEATRKKLEDAMDSVSAILKDTGIADIFESVTSKLNGTQLTISCQGVKGSFITKLEPILKQVEELFKSETETGEEEGEVSIPEDDFGSADIDLGALLKAFKAAEFTLELDVDMDAQIHAVRVSAGILQTETEEGLGEMTSDTTVSVSVTLTRGGQTVSKPADADQYPAETIE